MSRARGGVAEAAAPELMLRKATLARSSGMRAKYASRGLSHEGGIDRTTRAMLLRQLYLSHMEALRFEDALTAGEQMVSLDVMPDVAHQDAARACLALGDLRRAVDHLRLASRASPASRRAFHLWTLGSVLHLAGHHREAVGAFTRAARWGTTDRPLYQAQAAVARIALGEVVPDLLGLLERLTDAPCGQGYGQYVRGEISFLLGDLPEARRLLRAFVRRVTGGRVALAVALSAEVDRSQQVLERIGARLRDREQ